MKIPYSLLLAASLFAAGAGSAQAQKAAAAKTTPVSITFDPKLEETLKALYAVISGPAGQKRDWDQFRSLFVQDGRLGVIVPAKEGSGSTLRWMSPEDYISRSGPYLEKDGFFEKEISRKIERYGHLAQVFSTYEARQTLTDPKPLMRGINSIQLVEENGSWKISSLVWQQEMPGLPLPPEYLPAK